MGVIQVLDEQLSQLIAAGEVVERPSSVVKELVENSIDAGAAKITVEIRHGGVTQIRVSDDGSGIEPEDVPVMFLRHATSKVRTQDDLSRIATLGFRGEAMASIHAVSRVEVLTRKQSTNEGVRYFGEGESFGQVEPVGCPVGTTVKVSDLFFNTPARMKFLKKDSQEGNSVAGVVEKIALSHPEISFRFIRDGQTKLHTPGDGKLLSAIHAVYGRDFTKGLAEVNYTQGQITVQGYITLPSVGRANRTMQTFFVNGRYVKSVTARTALEEAYKHCLMVGKFPGCVLDLEIPFTETDINVHPAKIEIRFTDERPVFDAVYYAAKTTLAKQDNSELTQGMVHKKPMTVFDLERKPQVEQITLKELKQWQSAEPQKPQKMTLKEYHKILKEEEQPDSVKKEKAAKPNLLEQQGIQMEDIPDVEFVFHDSANNPAAQTAPVAPVLPPPLPKVPPLAEKHIQEPAAFEMDLGELDTLPESMTKPILKTDSKEKPVSGHDRKAVFSDEDVVLVQEQPKDRHDTDISQYQEEDLRLVGEVLGTFLVVEAKDRVVLVDKHAAHERLIFNKLKQQDFTSDRQLLLDPVMVHLSREDYQGAARNLELFQQAGFLVEDFGDGDLIVREVPTMLSGEEISELVERTAHDLAGNKKDLTPHALDDLLHSVACKSAVRANDKNSMPELREIIRMLCEDKDAKYCPHGRPIAKSFSRYELEKIFGRQG